LVALLTNRYRLVLLAALWLGACQSHREPLDGSKPPVGHYKGSIKPTGQPEVKAELDIRHPSPGHYEAELTLPDAATLSFVADTVFYDKKRLRLTRPGHPGEVLTVTLEGDFWRGSLALGSLKAEALLVRRGQPAPSTYRVEELPQAAGSAWLFAPSDVRTPGPALALLPDSATALAAPLWADALAREGVIVLVLPMADSATTGLAAGLRLLRDTPGADAATIGVWAAGARAETLAQELAVPNGLKVNFVVAQNTIVSPEARAHFRELLRQKLPVLGVYGGPSSLALQAPRLRAALGGKRKTVLVYREAGPDLLVPGTLGTRFAPGLPDEVVSWLRAR
jgi:hypothetical protein